MRNLGIFIVFCCYALRAQDSLYKTRLGFFDCSVFIGPNIYSHPDLNIDFVSKLTDRDLLPETIGYTEYQYNIQSPPEGVVFGINMSFKFFDPKHPFLKRVKPRLAIQGAGINFFEYGLHFSRTYTVDSLFFTDPNVKPQLIDSTVTGTLNYSYHSKLIFVELGANIDLFTLRFFNFYSGFFFSQGFSVGNEFKTEKREYYTIDAYPDQINETSGTLVQYTRSDNSPSSSDTRITLALGVQHRFSNRHAQSLGFFGELRPGLEFYKIRGGATLTQKTLFISVGLRFSFCRHK